MKLSRKALIRFIVVFVTIGIASLMVFGLQWQNQVKEHSKALNSELLSNSHRLNRAAQDLLNTLSRCPSEGCVLAEAIDSQINTLQQDIERFKKAASMEKTAITSFSLHKRRLFLVTVIMKRIV